MKKPKLLALITALSCALTACGTPTSPKAQVAPLAQPMVCSTADPMAYATGAPVGEPLTPAYTCKG